MMKNPPNLAEAGIRKIFEWFCLNLRTENFNPPRLLRDPKPLCNASLYVRECNLRTKFYVTDGNIMYLTDASRFLISCVIQHYAPVVGWQGWRNRCIMLIMTLDPSWRQTLSLPPPGIEPGSPASQAGTLPKELSRQLIPVLQIRDFYPRSLKR